MEKFSIPKLANRIPTEADAYALLEDLRWNGNPVCPHCGEDERCYFLKPANGVSRKTRTGAATQRRLWKCGACRKQFSVLTGTVLHGSKISVRTWLLVMFEMCSDKNGMSAREIERKYGLSMKAAWFMAHRIREAMKSDPLVMLTGTVVADETFVGGKPQNKHRHGGPRKGTPSWVGGGTAHLQPVLSLVNRETGTVRSQVVLDVTGATLRKAIAQHVDMGGSHLHTDAGMQYRVIGREFASHQWVDHGSREYVRGNVSTNQAENFFSQLKRSIDGTHHHVSRVHLPRYLAEFDFRFNTRKLSDTARTQLLIGKVAGRRLTYKQPVVV